VPGMRCAGEGGRVGEVCRAESGHSPRRKSETAPGLSGKVQPHPVKQPDTRVGENTVRGGSTEAIRDA
jgi:hypothetical protein